MRIVEDRRAAALYASFGGREKPTRSEFREADGIVLDLDEDGRLLDLMVLVPWRDWTPQLEAVLAEHPLPQADAARLRAAAAAPLADR